MNDPGFAEPPVETEVDVVEASIIGEEWTSVEGDGDLDGATTDAPDALVNEMNDLDVTGAAESQSESGTVVDLLSGDDNGRTVAGTDLLVDTTTIAPTADVQAGEGDKTMNEIAVQPLSPKAASPRMTDTVVSPRRGATTLSETEELKRKNASLTNELGNQIMKVRELESTLHEFEQTLVELSEQKAAMEGNVASSSELDALRMEKEAAQNDLESVERSFTELHARYERLRGVVDNQKTNEESLKSALVAAKEGLAQREAQFESLRNHAQSQLEGANDRIEEIERAGKADNAVLTLAVKRYRSEAASTKISNEAEMACLVAKHKAELNALNTKLAAVTAEKNELTTICDQLVDLSSLENH